MYLLSKVELSVNDLYLDIKGNSISGLNQRDAFFILDNPMHLEYLADLRVKDFKCIYDITDYISIKLNQELTRFLAFKTEENMRSILVSNHIETINANNIVELIVNNKNFKTFKLDKTIEIIKNIMDEIFYSNINYKESINKLSKYGEGIHDSYENFIYRVVLSNKLKKLTFIILLDKLRGIRKALKNINRKDGRIADCLNFLDCKIVFSNMKFSSIINNKDFKNKRYISRLDSFGLFYFKTVDNIIEKFKKCPLGNINMYLVKDSVVLKKLDYMDILKLKNGDSALFSMFNIFNEDNIDRNLIDKNTIDYLLYKKYYSILDILNTKFGFENCYHPSTLNDSKEVSLNKDIGHETILDIISKNYEV